VQVAEKMEKARDAKAGTPISAKTTDIDALKKDTRKEIAGEAKLPESKLRQAQALKKADPGLYEKVRSGESSMRTARKSLRTEKLGGELGAELGGDRGHFRDVGRVLGDFKGGLKEMLNLLARTSRGKMTPAQKKGLHKIAAILDDLSETADSYAVKFTAVLRPANRSR
jgi:hypothetical protein